MISAALALLLFCLGTAPNMKVLAASGDDQKIEETDSKAGEADQEIKEEDKESDGKEEEPEKDSDTSKKDSDTSKKDSDAAKKDSETDKEAAEADKKVDEADKKVDEAVKKAIELEEKRKSTKQEKKALQEQLDDIIREMNQTQEKISNKKKAIAKTEDDLVQAKVSENSQYRNMKMRIKFMYENGNFQVLEILFDSKSIADFLNKAEYVSRISEYDRDMLQEFQKTVKEIGKKEKKLDKEYKELEKLQDSLFDKQEQVDILLEQKNLQLQDLEKEIGDNAEILGDLVKKAQEERRKREEQEDAYREATSGIVIVGNGRFANPCPQATLSSGFGYRSFDSSFHKGLDLAAPTGTPTYAADDGVVLYACWSDSAGNWVVIDHGNGYVTKYMHHSALAVRAGEHVKKGQQIGFVGNTGDSYGSHLHFQVEYQGVPVNPSLYL